MTFGLPREHWQEIDRLVIRPLKAHQARVWVFGSRTGSAYRQFSDLDILYETPQSLPKGFLAGLQETVEESHLPIKIDLVAVSDLAAAYRDNVFKQRVAV